MSFLSAIPKIAFPINFDCNKAGIFLPIIPNFYKNSSQKVGFFDEVSHASKPNTSVLVNFYQKKMIA